MVQIDKFLADSAIAISSRYWHLHIEELTNKITFFQRNNQGKTTFFQRNGIRWCKDLQEWWEWRNFWREAEKCWGNCGV